MLSSKRLVTGFYVIAFAACESPVLQGDAMDAAGANAANPNGSAFAAAGGSSMMGATGAGTRPSGNGGADDGAGGASQSLDAAGASDARAAGVSNAAQVQLSDVVTYENLAQQVRLAADSYRNAMMAGDMTLADCATEHDQYDAGVRPLISQMLQMSGDMDEFMIAHDGAAYADFSCTAGEMMDELDSHRPVCSASDLSAAQAEAARDADAVVSYAEHAYQRCGQVASVMHGHAYMWSAMTGSCTISDDDAGGSDPAALGERIFESGMGEGGQPIPHTSSIGTGMMGGGMGMATACANCHGQEGHGLRTMMFAAPNITYANLTDPAGMREIDGSHGHTYTDTLIRRAVTQGIGADGDELDSIMPRWRLTDGDWNNLLVYLKTLP